jgi:alanyl-tRNA synthetase
MAQKVDLLLDTVSRRFNKYGFPLRTVPKTVLPDDPSTLFVCSGMQPLKKRFEAGVGGVDGTIQSCIRTNDLALVGDGTHLTYFEMIGNFSFGGFDYAASFAMWSAILRDLGLPVTHVTHHPDQKEHAALIALNNWVAKPSNDCVWSDGLVGGNCCEFFCGDIEIGNLVNPYGHSVDVGFGLERMLMFMEGVDTVDKTSVFDSGLDPIARDHHRALVSVYKNCVVPGNKGRGYVSRRLLRRVLNAVAGLKYTPYAAWIESEQYLRSRSIGKAKKAYKRNRNKPDSFWWETFGVLPEEIKHIAD